MNTSLNHGSATIYQFPVGGRASLSSRRSDEAKSIDDFSAATRASHVVVGGSWYHEEAIQDAKTGREH